MACAWRNFKNIFSRPLFTIIFRPEMLKFHPYSILTGETMVGFVIYCVLIAIASQIYTKYLNSKLLGPVVCFAQLMGHFGTATCTQFLARKESNVPKLKRVVKSLLF